MRKLNFSILVLLTFLFIFCKPSFASNILINEFLANPSTGSKEWVEFYNPDEKDLSSYWLDDDTDFNSDSGNSSKKNLSTINKNNLKYPYIELTSSIFNNSGDSVVFFDSSGVVIDQYQYSSDPGKDKSIGRSPDGESWISLTTSSKGASNEVITVTPTATTATTSTPTVSPTNAATIFTISNIPDQILSTQSFTASVNLLLPDTPNTNLYLKGAFKKTDSSNYFGLTKVGSSWIKNGSSYLSQLPVSLDSSGKWSGSLEIKPDIEDTGFLGEGSYIFKIGKYTNSGSGPTWSNEVSVNISHSANQGTVDNPTPTEEIKTNSPTPKKAVNLASSVLATKTSSIQISTPANQISEAIEIKSDIQTSFLIYIGVVLIFLGLILMAFLYHEKIFNKLR